MRTRSCPASRRSPLGGLLAVVVAVLLAVPAGAVTKRLGLLIANHEGGDELPTLRYVERDAQRLRDVLIESGGFDNDLITFLVDESADDVLEELAEIEKEIALLKKAGHEVVLLVYYSGHAANGVLRMGSSKLEMRKLKNLISASQADVRLAFLDSCGAGAMTREKGGRVAPPFVVSVEDAVQAKGQVIITSSSADEASQESDDIQGSFFTHYLTTGLRGAADQSGDGKVTLDEAYTYAYARTVATTANTRSGAQHPTYQYDLRGAGDVVLSKPGGADVILTFPEDLEGQYFVVDLDRQLFVAEIDKNAGAPSQISLPVGEYAIKKRLDTHLMMQRLEARNKGSFVVDERSMEQVSFEDDYAKGTPILNADLKAGLGFSMSVGTGLQAMPIDATGGYFPVMPFLSIEGRLTNVFTEYLMLSVDLGVGFRQFDYQFQDGSGTLPISYSQLQIGAAPMGNFTFGLPSVGGLDLGRMQLAAGPRMAMLHVVGVYDDPNATGPVHFQVMPFLGFVALAGYSPLSWFHLEGQLRSAGGMLDPNWFSPLMSTEVLLSAWVDF
jgi:hypothetical protein